MADRPICENCGLWVRLNSQYGGRGECVLPGTPNAPVKFFLCNTSQAALHTAFDYGCDRWIPRPTTDREAAEAAGGEK